MKAICNLNVLVDSKAPKPSSQTEEVTQGKKPRAKSGLKRKQSSKHTPESKTVASKSKTSQSKKDTQSSSTKDKSPSHPLPPTPVVGEMHKEAQQAASGPTSLRATSEEGSHPQLSSGSNLSVLVDKTKSAKDRLITAHTDSDANEESRADDISLKVKLEDLSNILKDIRSAFFTPDSLPDEPIIVSYESKEEEEVVKDKDTQAISHDVPKDTSVLPPPYFKISLNSRINGSENASGATSMNVPSAVKAITLLAKGEKNTNAEANLQKQLIDLLGIEVVEQYYSKKLL
nr:hypothetical protein [Tanacetum cinerariifolium]